MDVQSLKSQKYVLLQNSFSYQVLDLPLFLCFRKWFPYFLSITEFQWSTALHNALVLQCIAYCQFVSGTPIKLGSSPCISIRCVCPASGASCSIRCRTVIIGAAAICSWSLNILFHTRLWINKVASLTTAFLFVKSLTLTLVDNDLHLSLQILLASGRSLVLLQSISAQNHHLEVQFCATVSFQFPGKLCCKWLFWEQTCS